jgi:putative chitinase
MKFDRDAYFDAVRETLFDGALSQEQVDGQNLMLAVFEYDAGGTPISDIRWPAYMLATVFHETGRAMWPNVEGGSDAYLQGQPYWPYIGRGFVHLTWLDNYRNASTALGLIGDRDLVEHPEMARDSMIAARIMVRGMAEGWFTGSKLGHHFNVDDDDPYEARTIINGHDQADLIAGYHEAFLDALTDARE